jgi:hypothetical protein
MRGRVLAQRGDTQRALADFELANDLAVGEGRCVLHRLPLDRVHFHTSYFVRPFTGFFYV